MTAQTTQPAEGQRWCIVLRKPGTGSSAWVYGYANEAAARADIPEWAARGAYEGYTEADALPEPVDRPLLGERESGRA